MVKHVLDQQNAEIAKTIFSKEVQTIMELNGDLKEAKFVEMVCHWYEACYERGIKPNECVNHWTDMHNFPVNDVNFTNFPPPSTHVKGRFTSGHHNSYNVISNISD